MKMNLKLIPKITFKGNNHTYWDRENSQYMSVSSFFKKFKEPFDAEAISKKKALIDTFPKEYARLKRKYKFDDPIIIETLEALISSEELKKLMDELKSTWSKKGDNSRTQGTRLHEEDELSDIKKGFIWSPFDGRRFDVISPNKQFDNQSICDDLIDLEPGYYPELLIFNEKYRIAGQSDGVIITPEKEAYILDKKTDSSIDFKPIFRHPRSGYKRFFSPINHLTECNFNEYSIKMSLYAWMLEQFGFKVKGMLIENIKVDEKWIKQNIIMIPVPYRKEDVNNMLITGF